MYLFSTYEAAVKWAKSYGWSYRYQIVHTGTDYEVRWSFREPSGC